MPLKSYSAAKLVGGGLCSTGFQSSSAVYCLRSVESLGLNHYGHSVTKMECIRILRVKFKLRNTFYDQKGPHKFTWSNTQGHRSTIDYILTNEEFHPSQIMDIRALTSPDIGSEHNMVLRKLRNIITPRKQLEHDKNKHPGGCEGSAWDENNWKRHKVQIDTKVYRGGKSFSEGKKRCIFEIQKYEDSDRTQKIRGSTEQSEQTNRGDNERKFSKDMENDMYGSQRRI
ncbi:hypothetical protein HHI36_010700 [Cryptolaemus montrouzieri]|uniref:Uncharacterized protein n=1 Tax=Cryptolaemus montrouzieri TaxID=559131 RepID=A0ABD2MJV3_9CUCU